MRVLRMITSGARIRYSSHRHTWKQLELSFGDQTQALYKQLPSFEVLRTPLKSNGHLTHQVDIMDRVFFYQ